MKKIQFGTVTLLVFGGLAFAGAPEGKAVFTAKCQSCHGANGEGKPAVGKMFGVTMPALASKEVQSQSDADLKKVILAGKGKMKPVAGVSDEQAGDIVAFVRTLK